MSSVRVYVGNHGTYAVPVELIAKATDMNHGKSLDDRRTKGARHLDWWGRTQDSTEESKHMLINHYSATCLTTEMI